jgi:hypothetical protein
MMLSMPSLREMKDWTSRRVPYRVADLNIESASNAQPPVNNESMLRQGDRYLLTVRSSPDRDGAYREDKFTVKIDRYFQIVKA